MRISRHLLMAVMCSTAITAPAFAQDEGSSEAEDGNIIIVTATRRAEDVQDIPLAVTAVSPVQLERQGVVNVTQISQVSPSFSTSNAQNASGTNVLRIRGVGTTSNNIGFESAVGIFIDGAYQSRPGVALSEFVDVERVEVLRGPQGTLFGRNTSAGALNITNKRPDLTEFGGFVNASYGNYDLISVQGALNAPIVQDTLAARITGAYRKRDGYIRAVDTNSNPNGRTNEIDQYLVRGQLGFESDGGISARLVADYSASTASCCGAIEVFSSPLEAAGRFARAGLGARGGQVTNPAQTPFDTGAAQAAIDAQLTSINYIPTADIDQWGITAEVEFPLGDNADLIYIGSYRDFSAFETNDSDFTAIDVFNSLGTGTDIKTMTHELRIQGEALGGALSWLVGGYYSDEEINQTAQFGLGTDFAALTSTLIGFPGPVPPFFFGQDASLVRASVLYQQDSKSWSIFTHNTLEVAEGLKLTLGLRWSDESKDGSFTQTSVTNTLCPLAASRGVVNALTCFPFTAPVDLPEAATFALPRSFADTFNDDELIYTGKISYEFASPITVYASFTHGYKSGGFNLDASAAINGADPRFASEEVDAYEIGFKGKFLENAVTLNVAGFHQEFSNFQVLEFTGAQFQTFNVPKAISKGVEIETVIRPDDHFTVSGGLTYVDAAYPGDCATTADALRVQNLCGAALTNAPKLVAILGATYEDEIGDDLKFFLNGQIRTESDRRTSTQPSTPPTTAADLGNTPLLPFDIQDGNIKINARVGIGSAEDTWGIEAWVTNLTNERTRAVTFSTTLRGGSRSAFPQEPRTFGVTLRGQF